MSKSFYLPRKDKEKAIWLNNFASKFTSCAAELGFTAADVSAVNKDAAMFSYFINLIEVFTTEKEERVSYKDLLRDGPIGKPMGAFPSMPAIPAAPASVAAGIFPRIARINTSVKFC